MTISPLAGKPAPKELLVDVARLEREYFDRRPDLSDPTQRVMFGTSGHRGSSAPAFQWLGDLTEASNRSPFRESILFSLRTSEVTR